ncbi:MAG TPA: TonB family protein [Terriglobales bacterium]|jgi:TonB family protein|nr:TonB family protein [Terriglobales bacterium]
MASTEPVARPGSDELERYSDRHVVPVLVLEINDERSRSRLREAGLLSIIFHLLLIMTVPSLLKYSSSKKVRVWTAQELINRDRELTYLAMPKDSQQVSKRPNTAIISDKDRIATSRHPTLDEKTMRELRDSLVRPPAPNAPPSPPPQPGAQSAQQAAPRPNQPANQMARLEPPTSTANVPNLFARAPLSAGSAIEQAARENATRRAGGMGGGGGDLGGSGSGGRGGSAQGNLEILSDTMGVDFGPYLERVLHDVRLNWYNIIPEVARPPLMKKGKVSIEFAILKDGSVAGMKLDGPSGDVSLDRAAWGGITASNPFPPLPSEFRGQYLQLLFHFYYNPDRRDRLE